VTSVLVARHGRLVIERYYDGVGPTASVPVFSITKTVVSALVGMRSPTAGCGGSTSASTTPSRASQRGRSRQRRLFRPLGIRDVRWPGSHGGSGLVLRPRAVLAFGQLYLDGGTWRGRSILPAEWMQVSTRAHVDVPPGQGVTDAYGYGWWVQRRGELRSFTAHGYLGQVLAVFPHLDEVVLVTSSGERLDTFDVVRRIVAATRA
jgi:CubicO group peptidase (beta-lactamase class C family)